MKHALALPVLLLILCLSMAGGGVFLTDCDDGSGEGSFDPAQEGLMLVETARGDETEACRYVLASNGRVAEAGPFDPDPVDLYLIPDGCFTSLIEDGRVFNRPTRVIALDQAEQERETPNFVRTALRLLAQTEHALMNVRVLRDGEHTFVYAEHNVNLWTPCELYYVSPGEDRLILLGEWDGERVQSIRILSEARLMILP
ncbi:MAG: hypothetical protein IJ240_11390 [Clostridia bacterium]|nr:hypothetical protein [Clostridia bacterium]